MNSTKFVNLLFNNRDFKNPREFLSKILNLQHSSKGTDGKPIGSNYDFYVWNITNPKGFMAGQKPSLQQVGPFCYKNFNKHVNVSTQDGKGIVF